MPMTTAPAICPSMNAGLIIVPQSWTIPTFLISIFPVSTSTSTTTPCTANE